MKKLLFLSVAFFCALVANAQSSAGAFKPFKVDFAAGYAMPQGSGAKGGVLFAFEPKYAVASQITAGIRFEAAITARGFVGADGQSASAKVKAAGSYLATGEYYFNNNTFRPFAGLGLGLYKLASASFETDGTTTNTGAGVGGGSKFGTMIRAGFEASHFRLALEYNIVGKTEEKFDDGAGNTYNITSKNGYLGIKLGFYLGGGRVR